MKQSKLVSMIGALVVMISAVAFITACKNANDPKNNLGDSLAVKPTREADSTELTIEKFPVYDRKTEKVTVKKVVLKQW